MKSEYFQMLEQSSKVSELMEYRKWAIEIPKIKFPKNWDIRIIPPFGNAVVRFLAFDGKYQISVYLDCYDLLGMYGAPYWEMYPSGDDVARFAMNDVEGLINTMKEQFELMKNKDKGELE